MAALLVGLGVMAVMLTVAMPAWRNMVKREREEELIFRGQQYVRAIGLFQRKYAAAYPPSLDVLINGKFLRRKYQDPMTPDGDFQLLYQASQVGRGGAGTPQGQPQAGARTGAQPGTSSFGVSTATGTLGPRGGIIGVASKSTDESIRLYQGRNHYNEWQFIYAPSLVPGRGSPRPGMPGMGGRGRGPSGFGPAGPGGSASPGGRGFGPGGPFPGRNPTPPNPGGQD